MTGIAFGGEFPVMSVVQGDMEAIRSAAQALCRGQLVAFPTETVYGLGADASNPEALKRLYEAKGRPSKHPAIVHIASLEEAEKWTSEFPEAARTLGRIFWPGPLTIVLNKARHVPDQVTGGQNTVALRIPSHPVALALLKEFGGGIAAPSANKFGHISPTSAEDVQSEFKDMPELIVLNGGSCEVGIESTIVDLSGAEARILRPGMIGTESIQVALHSQKLTGALQAVTPRVPGSLPTHYAPSTPLRLVKSAELIDTLEDTDREGIDAAVLAFKPPPFLHRNWIHAKDFSAHYAHTLYRNLRKLDAVGAELIIVEEPPEGPEWEAIRDRLKRAAGEGEKGEECDGS